MKPLSTLLPRGALLAVCLAACAEPTRPATPERALASSDAARQLLLTDAARATIAASMDDAALRLAPAVAPVQEAAPLRAALTQLRVALNANDATAAQAALADVQSAIAVLRALPSTSAPDLSAVELSISPISAALAAR